MHVCDDALEDILPKRLLEVLYGNNADAGSCPDLALCNTVAENGESLLG